MTAIISLIIFLFIALISSNFIVKATTEIATIIKIPESVIALTLTSIGTSLPELVVSISSINKNASAIILGNIIGSNICNVLLCLSIATIIKTKIKIPKTKDSIEILFLIIATMLFIIFFFIIKKFNIYYGLISIATLILYNIILIKNYKTHNTKTPNIQLIPSLLMLCISTATLIYSSNEAVNHAIKITKQIGVSEAFIGSTIIAIGTSIPEIAITVAAITKNKMEVAIGNIIGSNIFNIIGILGVTSLIKNIPNHNLSLETLFMLITTIIIITILTLRKQITRIDGAIMLTLYCYYLKIII